MEFPDTTKEEDKISEDEAFRIFGELRKRYCNENCRDLDIVLNSLCFALVRLFELNTNKVDAERCGELVKNIVVKNLKMRA
jgi:hypothetical protein